MSEHRCQCEGCKPAPEMENPPIHVRTAIEIRGKVIVTLDGENVASSVCALSSGEDGWVYVYEDDDDGKKHMCRQSTNPHWHDEPEVCGRIRRGKVEMRWKDTNKLVSA